MEREKRILRMILLLITSILYVTTALLVARSIFPEPEQNCTGLVESETVKCWQEFEERRRTQEEHQKLFSLGISAITSLLVAVLRTREETKTSLLAGAGVLAVLSSGIERLSWVAAVLSTILLAAMLVFLSNKRGNKKRD